jgi:membrane protein
MIGVRGWIDLLRATFKDFSKDDGTWKAAALAYYTVFALPPLLVLILQIASAVWDPIEVRRTLTGEFQTLMGQDVAGQIRTMMTQAEQKVSGTGFRLVLSIAGLLFGGTGAFLSLQSALNSAWEVKPDPKKGGGIKSFVMKRLLSLGMVLGIAFLLLVSLALTSALSAAGDVLLGGFPKAVSLVLNFALSFAIITLLFAAIYKVLPDAKVEWRDVWVGAIATSLLFVVGKFLIGLYIGQSNPGNAFGAAGTLAVLLVWIYYASVILLLGAEFTQAWAKQHGRSIEPEEGAVRVIEREERIEEGSPREGRHVAAQTAARSDGRHDGAPNDGRRHHTPFWLRLPVAKQAHSALGTVRHWTEETVARIRWEFSVARREVGVIIRALGTGTALAATGAVFGLLGLFAVLTGVVLLIGDQWLSRDRYWLAALIVAIVAAVVTWVFARRGMQNLAPGALAPRATIETPR